MAEQDSDTTEKATPHKIQEARKKGSVAKSNDFNSMAMIAALTISMFALGWDGFRQTMRLQKKILTQTGVLQWDIDVVAAWLGQLLIGMLTLLGPFLLTLAVAAILINLIQVGAIFTFHPIKPDFERINPSAGLKKIFSMRTLVEGLKSLLKLAVLGSVVQMMIRDAIPGMVGLPGADPKAYAQVLIGLCAALLAKLVFALLVLGGADMIYTRWEFAKRMRMSKRDVRDEHKNREGDPRIRARIKRLRKDMLKRSASMRKVADADVLITNPTHIAVALTYQHGTSAAPQVIAKGAGELAHKMRILARKHHIPIVQNRLLARLLFSKVDYDGYVPEQLYPEVARIMIWVYSMRAARRASGRAV